MSNDLADPTGHLTKLHEFKVALRDGVKTRKQAAAAAMFKTAPDDAAESDRSKQTAAGSATAFTKQGGAGSMDLIQCVKAADSLIEFFQRLEAWMGDFAGTRTLSEKCELAGPPLAESLEKEVSARPEVSTLRTKLRYSSTQIRAFQ
jgi:hypothetical protein